MKKSLFIASLLFTMGTAFAGKGHVCLNGASPTSGCKTICNHMGKSTSKIDIKEGGRLDWTCKCSKSSNFVIDLKNKC